MAVYLKINDLLPLKALLRAPFKLGEVEASVKIWSWLVAADIFLQGADIWVTQMGKLLVRVMWEYFSGVTSRKGWKN